MCENDGEGDGEYGARVMMVGVVMSEMDYGRGPPVDFRVCVCMCVCVCVCVYCTCIHIYHAVCLCVLAELGYT